jgi:RNA-directed DNA polymerase
LREEPVSEPKPFSISKRLVVDAFKSVKANKGAPGADDETIAEFEADLKGNLYKLWNRMSSGSYFPQPVRAVEIPKKDGKGSRILGVPTVTDRIAQTVVKMVLEPELERVFHDDSYGYRPGRSALDAVGVCRRRCWKADWVIDLDVKVFFDTVDHDLILKAVGRHTDQQWVLLYVGRWLQAPTRHVDGTVEQRERGTPQGSAISPLLANLFMHYAFDVWMGRKFPTVAFERYCDDVVVHCTTEKQARFVKDSITRRLADVGLEVHPDKTRIVYCKDTNRSGSAEHERFDFLGYTFRPRLVVSKTGEHFVSFVPGVSGDAKKAIGKTIRALRINRRSDRTLEDFAAMVNPLVRGWINYYGRFYRSELHPVLRRINTYLIRWAAAKYKRLHASRRRARRWLVAVSRRQPHLFAHWQAGMKPEGWTIGAV